MSLRAAIYVFDMLLSDSIAVVVVVVVGSILGFGANFRPHFGQVLIGPKGTMLTNREGRNHVSRFPPRDRESEVSQMTSPLPHSSWSCQHPLLDEDCGRKHRSPSILRWLPELLNDQACTAPRLRLGPSGSLSCSSLPFSLLLSDALCIFFKKNYYYYYYYYY